eukprot:GILK01006537.1.p1 GENE.GILK01006537.1~~GILK01006537.1.p1  ORF type:complete len:503 (-),score=78.92 GILK01006537.1:236-1702(-)
MAEEELDLRDSLEGPLPTLASPVPPEHTTDTSHAEVETPSQEKDVMTVPAPLQPDANKPSTNSGIPDASRTDAITGVVKRNESVGVLNASHSSASLTGPQRSASRDTPTLRNSETPQDTDRSIDTEKLHDQLEQQKQRQEETEVALKMQAVFRKKRASAANSPQPSPSPSPLPPDDVTTPTNAGHQQSATSHAASNDSQDGHAATKQSTKGDNGEKKSIQLLVPVSIASLPEVEHINLPDGVHSQMVTLSDPVPSISRVLKSLELDQPACPVFNVVGIHSLRSNMKACTFLAAIANAARDAGAIVIANPVPSPLSDACTKAGVVLMGVAPAGCVSKPGSSKSTGTSVLNVKAYSRIILSRGTSWGEETAIKLEAAKHLAQGHHEHFVSGTRSCRVITIVAAGAAEVIPEISQSLGNKWPVVLLPGDAVADSIMNLSNNSPSRLAASFESELKSFGSNKLVTCVPESTQPSEVTAVLRTHCAVRLADYL